MSDQFVEADPLSFNPDGSGTLLYFISGRVINRQTTPFNASAILAVQWRRRPQRLGRLGRISLTLVDRPETKAQPFSSRCISGHALCEF